MQSKQMKFRQARKLLEDNGWKLDRVRGSHYIFVKGKKEFPLPWCKIVRKYIARNLLKAIDG